MFYMVINPKLHEEMQKLFVNFDKALNAACKRNDSLENPSDFVVVPDLERPDATKLSYLVFARKEIAIVANFDPSNWNKWPEVDPPVGVWMRVETDLGLGFKSCVNSHGTWVDGKSEIILFCDVGRIVRFRPWEDL